MAVSTTLARWGVRRHNDEDVFTRAFAGDPVAFSEVYRRYQKPIYGYCLARLMEPEAAADATQEVFARFLDAPRYDIDHPRAWLYTVAHNATIDAIRKRARAPLPTDGEALEVAVGTSKMGASDVFQAREDARNVFLALRRLRPRYRTALILREMHHQSTADMADALDTTPGAVDTLVSRARDAFGRTYGEVSNLPDDCRNAVASIYKSTGTGLDDAEDPRLQSHLVACEGCRAEMKRSTRLDRLSALLPFLVPAKEVGQNVFERAAATLQTSPELALRLGYALPAERMTPAVKVASAVVAITLMAAPIAGTVAYRHHATLRPTPVVSTFGSRNAAGQWAGQSSAGLYGAGDRWQRGGRSSDTSWESMSGLYRGMYGPNRETEWSSSDFSMEGGTSTGSPLKESSMITGSDPTRSTWSSGTSHQQTTVPTSKPRQSPTSSPRGTSSADGSGSQQSGSGTWSGTSGSTAPGDSMSSGW